jgi:hypothetical protein
MEASMMQTANDNTTEGKTAGERAVRQFLTEHLIPGGEIETSWHSVADRYDSLRAEHDWPDIGPIDLMRRLGQMGCTVRSTLCLPPTGKV